MKQLSLLIVLCCFFSCADREVQLAQTSFNDITEIADVSPAYIFYNDDGTADFNRKNLIGTTNWLVNVDKRLSLKQAMPHIMYLQEKRKKASMHKNDDARNYFTCFNPDVKNLSFINFSAIDFHFGDEFLDHKSDTEFNNMIVESMNNIQIVTPDNNVFSTDVSSVLDIIKDSLQSSSKGQMLYVGFSETLSFQDYIALKTLFLSRPKDSLKVSNTEVIYK